MLNNWCVIVHPHPKGVQEFNVLGPMTETEALDLVRRVEGVCENQFTVKEMLPKDTYEMAVELAERTRG